MKNSIIDDYIENCTDFAHPILHHLRQLIHESIPNVEEHIKWRMPSFELDGKIICSIAGFKKHCVLRFTKGYLMDDPENILIQIGKTNMSHIGNINHFNDLPADEVLKNYLRSAVKIIA